MTLFSDPRVVEAVIHAAANPVHDDGHTDTYYVGLLDAAVAALPREEMIEKAADAIARAWSNGHARPVALPSDSRIAEAVLVAIGLIPEHITVPSRKWEQALTEALEYPRRHAMPDFVSETPAALCEHGCQPGKPCRANPCPALAEARATKARRTPPDLNAGQAAWLDYHFPASPEPAIPIAKLREWLDVSIALPAGCRTPDFHEGKLFALRAVKGFVDEHEKGAEG